MYNQIIMDSSTPFLRTFGLFFLRTLLGLIFLMQGFGKVFSWGVSNVYQNIFAEFESTWIPTQLLHFVAYFTSYVELIGGLLLILGLLRQWAYVFLSIVLLIVAYGHGLESPIWDLQHVFFRAAILGTLMLIPIEWDTLNLDHWIRSRQRN
jgi:uncharacterized membrane protein YphA (DoxX/SURF4 family)